MTDLSDTEQIILSYLRSHPPEECMLDKISMGTGKSRATVLKYLGTLHARGILDYRYVGRSKLWTVKEVHEPVGRTEERDGAKAAPPDAGALVATAAELHGIRVREAEMSEHLDLPETIVLTLTDGWYIVVRNRLFSSVFPDASDFLDLVRPGQIPAVEAAVQARKKSGPVTADLDLREKAGVYRPYRITFFPQAGCTVVVGEDLSAGKRSRRHLEALLYIIRTAGSAPDEAHLLGETMRGVREKLLPYLDGAVFMGDNHRTAYSTWEITEDTKTALSPLLTACTSALQTVSAGREGERLRPPVAGTPVKTVVAIPIIEEETAVGALALLLDADVTAADIENIEIVADEIASALKMQRLDRERTEYVNTLLAMNQISTILNEAEDERSILEQSIDAAMNTLGFEMGCVYLKDEEGAMIPRVHRNMPENLRTMCISGMFDGLFERAFRERNVVYITEGMPGYADLNEVVKANGVRTLLILPIKYGGRVVGLLNMGSTEEKHYMQTSLENISSIGLQLGVALERSVLARALEERAGKKAER
ncbi:MAG: GAF domain-containing protein [Methanofollis liminatans]|nr:GAF domain-containing protein [Methanofollis liminatans]